MTRARPDLIGDRAATSQAQVRKQAARSRAAVFGRRQYGYDSGVLRMAKTAEELERTWDFCRRIDFAPDEARLAAGLLDPIASLLGAETAVCRVFSALRIAPRLTTVVGLGVPDYVHDAYLERYFKLDPARRLLTQRFTRPVFADRFRRGEWLSEHATTNGDERIGDVCLRNRYREEFRRYRDEFLVPNNLCHHVGFCFQDPPGSRMFLLNFHRSEESSPFNRLDRARAKIVSVVLHAKAAEFGAAVGSDGHGRRRAGIDDPELLIDGRCNGRDTAVHSIEGSCSPLSARELEVAQTVARGLTNKQIAATLSISVRTVENHMRSIFTKLQVTTRTCLAAKLHGADLDRGEVERDTANVEGGRDKSEPRSLATDIW